MSDPTSENAGATPPENPPAGEEAAAQQPAGEAAAAVPAGAGAAEEQTAAMAAAEPSPAQQPAAAGAEAPTAVYAAPSAGAHPAPPRQAWYRRRWALITGAVAAAVILFLGGLAVGTAIGGNGHDRFRGDGRGMFPGGQGFGHEGWGDSGSGRGMMPGQGYGHQGWDQDGDGYGQPQAPGATPAPLPSQSANPQALTQ